MNKTYNPNHRVIIKDLKTGDVKYDISNDLVSITTNKAYGRVAGTWQIALTYQLINGQRYDELIAPGDFVTIELDAGDGKGLQPVMIGLVDRVARVFNGAGNKPQRYVMISGQDLGKLLTRDIGWDISGAQVQVVQEQGEGAPTRNIEVNYLSRVSLQAGTSESLITQLLDIFIQALESIAADKFVFVSTTDDDWEVWDSSLQYIRGTTLWAAMERYTHKPWNMLHADTLNIDSFQITLERNPIDDQGMLTRPESATHRITDADIVHENIGLSDVERVNLMCYWPSGYKVSPNMTIDIVMASQDLTKFDEDEIKLQGYCAHVIEDNFNPKNVKTVNDQHAYSKLSGPAISRAEAFWNWYSMNHELESGTFVVHGNPAMKAGDVLLVQDGTSSTWREYLIEQIGHSYSVFPTVAFTTTMHVTRGQVRG